MKAKGTFNIKKWEETVDEEISTVMKTTKASVEYAFAGEAEGMASVEYFMFYRYFDLKDPHKSSAVYVGLLKFSGNLSGKEGSFFMEENGTFENGTVNSTLRIVSGSGLRELEQISGTGHYHAGQDGSYFELDYSL